MDENEAVKQMIANLRGGYPDRCDFCEQLKEEHELHPEEAGMWICNECIKRIGYGGSD